MDTEVRSGTADRWFALGLGLAVLLLHLAIGAVADFDDYFVKYNFAARAFLNGTLPTIRMIDMSPLYLEFMIWVERAFGGPNLALVPVGWIQRVVVAASAGFLYLALKSHFSRGWSLAGIAIFALEPHVMVYERIFEPEILLLFFLLGCIASVERKSTASALFAGGFAACAIATRPTFLPLFLLLAPLYFWLRGERGSAFLERAAFFLVPVILCVIGLGLRVERITGDATTPVMNPGTVFFEGNHPLSQGISAGYPPILASLFDSDSTEPDEAHPLYRKVANHDGIRPLSVTDVNAYWGRKALAFILAEPRRYCELLSIKALNILRDNRLHDTTTAANYDAALPTVRGLYASLSALALLGMVFSLPRWRESLFFYAFAITQVAVMLIFYVSARQQMVMIPSLIFFAVVALQQMAARRRSAIAGVAIGLPLIALSMGRNDLIRDEIHRSEGTAEAAAIAREFADLESSQPFSARPEFPARVLAAASWTERHNVPGNIGQEQDSLQMMAVRVLREKQDRDDFDEFDLATLELDAGALAEAKARFERLVAIGLRPYRGSGQPSDPLFYLGRIAGLEGRREDAIDLLGRARSRTPGDPFVLAELAAMTGLDQPGEEIHRYYSGLDAHLLLGEAYLFHHQSDRAVVELEALVRRLPKSHRGRVALAVAYGESGKIEKGVAIYLDSLVDQSTPVIWSPRISALFGRWAAMHPGDLEVQLEAVRILFFHGRFQQALELLETEHFDDPRAMDRKRKIRDALHSISQPTHK